MADKLQGKTIAILATEGVEQIELTEPRKAVEAEGADVELLSLEAGDFQGFDHLDKGDTFTADKAVADADVDDYDGLILPGGVANPDFLRADEDAVAFVRDFVASDKPLGVDLPRAVDARGGRRRSRAARSRRGRRCRPTCATPAATWVDEEVHVDEGLVSSRNPDDLPAFCAKIVEEFCEGRHAKAPEPAGTGASTVCNTQLPRRHPRCPPDGCRKSPCVAVRHARGWGRMRRMARSIWTGAISFGLVTVPVKLYSAVSRKTVRFHQLNSKTGVRIQQKRVDPSSGDEVAYEDIVKGYELSPDRYVVIEPDELSALEPKKTKTIEIEDFVELADIDPILYDHPYYLAPGAGRCEALPPAARGDGGDRPRGDRPRRDPLQGGARRHPARWATCWGCRRCSSPTRSSTPTRSTSSPPPATSDTTKRELDIAKQLIDSLAGPFEPDSYHDEYRDQVLNLVERKAAGEEIAVQPEAEEDDAPVPDLMAALKASLDQVRDRDAERRRSRSRRPPPRRRPAKKARPSRAKKPAAKKKTTASS